MRVLIADDDEGVRVAVRRWVSRFATVDVAATVAEARALLSEQRDWSGFLFDLSFGPGDYESGLLLLESAREAFPDVPAVLMSGCLHRVDPDVVRRTVALDAQYWPKMLGRDHFRQLARLVTRREKERERSPHARTERARLSTVPPPPGAEQHFVGLLERLETKWGLTLAQRELFRGIVEHGLTRAEYRERSGISEGTLNSHTKALLDKSGAGSLDELARRTLEHALLGRR